MHFCYQLLKFKEDNSNLKNGQDSMTYHWISNNSNTMDATSGAGTTYPSGSP